MSRIRSIHPGLWTDVDFVGLSAFARLLFVGLWNECDDKGIFVWSPLQLKMRVLPADNVDAAALLDEIEAAGSIKKYEVGGKLYGAVRNFAKFQRPKKPNNIHPASAQILAFAGHNSELDAFEDGSAGDQLPTGGEIPPQMEDGGGKEELEPNGSRASCDAPEVANDDDSDGLKLRPEHIVEKWNELAPTMGKPRVRNITPERRQLLKARIAQYPIDDFVTVFGNIRGSPFLRGDTGKHFCTFDWAMKKANFQKILEGNYDG